MSDKKKLSVWWIPQVPMKSFMVEVFSVAEGVRIMDILARYDAFQFENNIKPDYCNAGGLSEWCDDLEEGPGWIDWCDEETGEDDPRRYLEMEADAAERQEYTDSPENTFNTDHNR